SKIEAGHLELEQAPFMLDDVVHHVCTVALHNAHAGGIELVVDMDPNMQIALIGDAGRLQQIIMNLVTNAVKFTGPGGQICVTLKQGHAEPLPSDTCPEQRRVQIICFVRDTGVGIAPEFLGQLFQPFRQVDASTTRRHGGTGLGLCICRQLVEMMHGEIWVESEPNVGSTFAFSIPLCTQPDSGATAQLPPPPAQPIHALVLSASPLQTEILCRHFSALGIDALTATNTEEAVRKAQELPKKQPDLLFLDRKLSEPNTLYALRALRTAFGRTIPAILMDEHAGEQILSVSNRDAAQHDGQVAILSLVTLRGLHESIVSLNEPCLVAYSGRLHPQPSPMETPLFHDVRILVAEDNPTNQEIMEALFEDTGVQLTIVSNGKQALDALRVGAQRGERFDLVLMDVQMPVMDGYEATRIIRTMPELEGLPIVAITAHAMHEDKMRALSAGIARYLSKPLSRAALFGTLRALLPNKILPRKPEQATHRSESAALSAPIVLNNTALPPCLDAGAIERLNVSPETYQKILRGYVRNTSEALPALRKGLYLDPAMPEQALCRPAWEWLIREAHNLKGASANVGAIAVQQDAHALELALKQFVRQSGNAAVETAALAQTFSPLLGALEEAFATVQTSVLEALPETPQPQEAPPQPVQAGTLDEDQKAQLQHFKEMLALADPERIAEALMPLTAFLPSALMEKLQQAIDFYDYDEALALLPPDTL
ncbi:hybrid sensor histidine kinase/response regulator, partial [Bilophila wadsworthia]